MSMLGKPLNRSEPIELVHARTGMYITLGTLSFLLNLIFLIAVKKSWKMMKQRRITYHISNLAFSDAVVGAATALHFIVGDNEVGNALVVCAWTAILTSLLAISVMATERALAIKFPHHWVEIFPLRKVFMVMFSIWLGTLAVAILMYYYDLVMRFILLVLFYVPIMITSFLYFYIYYKLWRKGEKATSDINSTQSIERKKRLYQRKVGSFVLFLTAVLMFTVSPSFLTLAVKNGCEVFEFECAFMDTITYLSYYFYMLEITNFVVNPVIYVWKMTLCRRALWRLFEKDGPVGEISGE